MKTNHCTQYRVFSIFFLILPILTFSTVQAANNVNFFYFVDFTDSWLSSDCADSFDLNDDCIVNFKDFAIFSENWLSEIAVMAAPANGSTFTNSTMSFTWLPGNSDIDKYFVEIGTGPNDPAIHDLNSAQVTPPQNWATFSNLPTDGRDIYVRLSSRISGYLYSNKYNYKAQTVCKAAEMTSPTPGSTISSSVFFQWNSGVCVTQYYLQVGTAQNGTDIFNSSVGTNLSQQVNSIPQNGNTIYVKLLSLIGRTWQEKNYTYTAYCGGSTPAWITSPPPESTLRKTITFKWVGGQCVTEYYLKVGTTSGGTDIFGGSIGTDVTKQLTNIPIDGNAVYVTLRSKIAGQWYDNSYLYACGNWELKSDTWVATDALGRALPDNTTCGDPRKNKQVGIFYVVWHGAHSATVGPWNISDIMAANPNALSDPRSISEGGPWGDVTAFHHWGQSELGYYRSLDPYVPRKHIEMLVDAGIDVLILDETNNDWYHKSQYELLCDTLIQLKNEGVKVPKVCWMARYGPSTGVNMQLIYNDVYSQNKYSSLWFYWLGKPLFLLSMQAPGDPEPSTTLTNFFTIRKIWAWSSSPWFGTGQDKWLFHDNYQQNYGWHTQGVPEQTSVSVAMQENYMSDSTGHGRHYHNYSQPPSNQWNGSGYHFQEQWNRALQIDPNFIFINEWNEWCAQRLISGTHDGGGIVPVGWNFFVDQFTQEYSRDVEPMKNGHTDNYYYQMTNYIRKYKGVSEREMASPPKTITIDGNFTDWQKVGPEYRDFFGDTLQRNYAGWGTSLNYTNTTGRNDIIETKVAHDAANIYFYARTEQNLTTYTGTNWMLLFIDIDRSTSTGWQGYDYLINSTINSSTQTTLKSRSGSSWVTSTQLNYRAVGNEIEISVPRTSLGLSTGIDTSFEFDFHWADNIQALDSINEFFVSGDSAPDRRFNYRYKNPTDVFIDLGATDYSYNLTPVIISTGNTQTTVIGGKVARKNTNPASDWYMYFNVADSFAYAGNKPAMNITVTFYDNGLGTFWISYDSSDPTAWPHQYYKSISVNKTNTNTWKQHTFKFTDAYFGNRQNGGADFRLWHMDQNSNYALPFYVDKIWVWYGN